MKKSLLFLFVCLTGFRLWAGDVTVRALSIQGNEKTEEQAIRAVLKTRVGDTLSAEMIRQDIEAIFHLGSFEDIRVEKEPFEGGVRLIYLVEERSKVTRITFEGNKKVKEEKLREFLDVKPFTAVDDAGMASTMKKIQDHYAAEGYHLAEVTPDFKTVSGSKDKELIFHIREGEGVRIRRVNFIGNQAFSDAELKSKLKSQEKGYWSWLSGHGKYEEEGIRRDVAFLVYHYQNNGYLKVKVGAPKVYLSRDKKWMTLTFHITEGHKYKVSKVSIEGDMLTTPEEMESKLVAKSGETYSRKKVEEDLLSFSQLYGDQGYAFANINPVIQPHDEPEAKDPYTADITYSIQKGHKVTIERINISGNTLTRDKVIRREIPIKENTLYNETKLRQAKQRLEALGYFEEVNFATPRGSSDDKIQMNITVKEKPTGTFSIGAGFSSAENFIFTASVAKNNFFGYGISGQLSTELSSRRQYFVLSFEDPYFLDSSWILGLSAFRTVNVFTDFNRSSFGGSLTLGHRILDTSIFRWSYQVEDVNLDAFRTAIPAVFSQNLSGLTSSMTLSLQKDTRNNRLFPSKGVFNSVSSEFAGIGGDNEFARLTENFRYYLPLWKSLVGKLNFSMGEIYSLNNLPVPLFERYFLGGVNSLRGYFLRSVGPSFQMPVSPQGGDTRFVYGGNKNLQFNTELEFPLYEPAGFKLVTFFDAGQAFAEEEQFTLKGLRTDYGFGLRWNSPLGPLRFEWGIPIDRRPGEDSVIFNFTIGSFF